jgi:hypothetical protein
MRIAINPIDTATKAAKKIVSRLNTVSILSKRENIF